MNKIEGKHYYDGEWDPSKTTINHAQHKMFSVGIFKWIPKANPENGLKRTAVIFRVHGKVSDIELVYSEAKWYCDMLDAGANYQHKALL